MNNGDQSLFTRQKNLPLQCVLDRSHCWAKQHNMQILTQYVLQNETTVGKQVRNHYVSLKLVLQTDKKCMAHVNNVE